MHDYCKPGDEKFDYFATHLLDYGFIRIPTFSRQILILIIFPTKLKKT